MSADQQAAFAPNDKKVSDTFLSCRSLRLPLLFGQFQIPAFALVSGSWLRFTTTLYTDSKKSYNREKEALMAGGDDGRAA